MTTPANRFVRHYGATFGWVAAIIVILVGLHGFDYANASRIYDNNIRACERGKLDRAANIKGWRAAYAARTNAATHEGPQDAANDLATAAIYADIIADLQSRIRPCEELIRNKPRFFPT